MKNSPKIILMRFLTLTQTLCLQALPSGPDPFDSKLSAFDGCSTSKRWYVSGPPARIDAMAESAVADGDVPGVPRQN